MFLFIFLGRALTAFVLGYFCRTSVLQTALEHRDSISIWEMTNFSDQDNKDNVTLQDKKDGGLPSSGFLSCDVNPQCTQHPHGLLFSPSMGLVGQGESLWIQGSCYLLCCEQQGPGASDLGMLWPLQLSMKMCQPNFSACREGKNLRLFTVLDKDLLPLRSLIQPTSLANSDISKTHLAGNPTCWVMYLWTASLPHTW